MNFKDSCRANDADKVKSIAIFRLRLPPPAAFKGKTSELGPVSLEEVKVLMADMLDGDDLNFNAAVSLIIQYLLM